MWKEKDEKYLNDPNMNCALEKYFFSEYYNEGDHLLKNDSNCGNGTLQHAYKFSNELLSKVFDHFKKNPERVLTVGSSYDQALNAVYHGAKCVDVIDANLFAKPWGDYKIAMIKNLEFDEFCDLFFSASRCSAMFDQDVYSRIFHDLPDDSKVFWGTVFLNENRDPSYFVYINTLMSDTSLIRPDSMFYKNKKDYDRLKKRLCYGEYEINYIPAEFADFSKRAGDNVYDIIILSNVRDYVKNKTFYYVVGNLYKNNLKSGGSMEVGYSFRDDTKPKWAVCYFKTKYASRQKLSDSHSVVFLDKPKKEFDKVEVPDLIDIINTL